jgi:hypothetical protein
VKIVRDFVAGREGGWIPFWMPPEAGFSDTDGVLLVHDLLEHRLCDTGQVHEEIMAFGRMLALRVHTGVLDMSCERLGMIALDTILDSEGFPDNMRQAPPYEPHRDIWTETEDFMQGFKAASLRDPDDRGWENIVYPDGFYANVAAWFDIGYRDALRHYGRAVYDIAYIAQSECERVQGSDAESGERFLLRIEVDTETRRARHTTRASYELRERQLDRINRWRTINERHAPY